MKVGVPSYWGGAALDTTEVQHSYDPSSVADPGSSAFLTLDPGSQTHVNNTFWVKNTKFFIFWLKFFAPFKNKIVINFVKSMCLARNFSMVNS